MVAKKVVGLPKMVAWLPDFGDRQVGLGSIGTTSSDRQSGKIDVQHERTLIAELDTPPPPYLHCFPYPQNTKEPSLFFKKTAALSRPPLKLHYDRYYRAR